MKLLRSSSVLLALILSAGVSAQNLIGYSAGEIKDYMRKNHKTMNFQSMIYNKDFKYLKYTDRNDTQTLLFFLSADSVCRSVRSVCDRSLRDQKIMELDEKYRRSGENVWTETRQGKKYIIELKDDEWSFNVTIRPND